jgi:hypothetical protein
MAYVRSGKCDGSDRDWGDTGLGATRLGSHGSGQESGMGVGRGLECGGWCIGWEAKGCGRGKGNGKGLRGRGKGERVMGFTGGGKREWKGKDKGYGGYG